MTQNYDPNRDGLEIFQSGPVCCETNPRTLIEVGGVDRAAFLHNFCTNDIKGLAVGTGCEAIFTSVKARIIAHGWIFAAEDRHWIDLAPGQVTELLKHLDRYVINEDVEFTDRTADFRTWMVATPPAHHQGPEGCSIRQLGDEPPRLTLDWNWPVDVIRVPTDREIANIPAVDGLDLGITIARQLWECFRIERGIPEPGTDFNSDMLAQELDRTQYAISFRKGCYLGQEPIARLDAMGHVNKALRCVIFKSNGQPPFGELPVFPSGCSSDAEAMVGRISSFALHKNGRTAVGMGLLKRSELAEGTHVDVMTEQGPCDGIVFWTPEKTPARPPGDHHLLR